MALRWLTAALDDLRGIGAYIAEGNPDAARRVIAHIHSETEILNVQPNIGRVGRIPDTRSYLLAGIHISWLIESKELMCKSLPWCIHHVGGLSNCQM